MKIKKLKTIEIYFFFMREIYKVSKLNVYFTIINELATSIFAIFMNTLLPRIIFNSLSGERDIRKVSAILAVTCSLYFIFSIIRTPYLTYIRPKADNKIDKHFDILVFNKASGLDLNCFYDSGFYNNYKIVLDNVKKAAKDSLYSVTVKIVNFSVVICVIGYYILILDFFVLFLQVFWIVLMIIVEREINKHDMRVEQAVNIDNRIKQYVNKVFFQRKYAHDMRSTELESLMKAKYDGAADSITKKTVWYLKKKAKLSIAWALSSEPFF